MSVDCSIGAAAELVGLHPQTLRDYERLGLLQPRRSSGGTRRYGHAEFVRIRRIMQLTSEGLNLAGVRHVLELEEQLRAARARIEQLERGSRRSVSLELVHLPRSPRSPRWRNDY